MSFRSLVVLPLATSPSPVPSLSQSSPTSPLPGESDSTWLGPGLLGFLSLVFLAVAVFVIYRSLNKQLGRVTFDEAAVNHDVVDGGAVLTPDTPVALDAEAPSDGPGGPAPSA